MAVPDVEYARNGDVSIAFQVLGRGPGLLVIPGWASHLERNWELPGLAELLDRLSGFATVVIVDRRGSGLSDPFGAGAIPTLEDHVEDMRAVLRHAGLSRAGVLGMEDSSMLACVLAARHPEVVTSLVLYSPRASGRQTTDYPWQWSPAEWAWHLERVAESWGTTRFAQLDLREAYPSVADQPEAIATWARYLRNAASPASAVALLRQISETDVRDILPAVRAPTILIRPSGDELIDPATAEYIASRIAGSRVVDVAGRDMMAWFSDDVAAVAAAVAEGITGAPPPTRTDRRLATVLFTDIVDSTARAAALGDSRWREIIASHNVTIRSHLARHRGREVDTAGDGFFATFDGPAAAIRCALESASDVSGLGIEVRAGVHTGEVETIEAKVGGLAVQIGARIAALARPSEVLVSQTVKDLVAGSGLAFADAGEHELRGVPDRWRLYRVAG